MAFTNPSVADFKAYFNRDFPYGTDINVAITDTDIAKGMQQTNANLNVALFTTQDVYTIAYLLLSAHYMVEDLRASSQGINGQYNFLQASKSVSGVSESFNIPQQIMDNPTYSMFCKTNYGKKYIAMMLPRLTGVMFSVPGRTQA